MGSHGSGSEIYLVHILVIMTGSWAKKKKKGRELHQGLFLTLDLDGMERGKGHKYYYLRREKGEEKEKAIMSCLRHASQCESD